MTGSGNAPRCSVCGFKLVKNGRTSAGRTRWRCKKCGASATQSRGDITAKSQLAAFLAWVLGSQSLQDLSSQHRSVRRNFQWCWGIAVPQPMVTGQIYDQIIVDGTYFQGWCVLIAHNGTHVIGWQWCDRENKAAWLALLRRFPPPRVVITDGGVGLRSALDTLWPKVGIQRCFFHIRAQIRRAVTLNPRLQAGKEIWALTLELMKVNDLDQAATWMGKYGSWESRWDEFFKERTYMRQGLDRPRNINPNARWWYTHRNLRSVRATYRRLIKDQSLFTHLQPQFQSKTRIDRTTSRLEGGVNAQIKNLLRIHRGMHEDHARRAIEWFLNTLTEQPHDPWTLAKTHQATPPPAPRIIEEPIGPKEYGTALNPEEGLYLRKGWAGRWQP